METRDHFNIQESGVYRRQTWSSWKRWPGSHQLCPPSLPWCARQMLINQPSNLLNLSPTHQSIFLTLSYLSNTSIIMQTNSTLLKAHERLSKCNFSRSLKSIKTCLHNPPPQQRPPRKGRCQSPAWRRPWYILDEILGGTFVFLAEDTFKGFWKSLFHLNTSNENLKGCRLRWLNNPDPRGCFEYFIWWINSEMIIFQNLVNF